MHRCSSFVTCNCVCSLAGSSRTIVHAHDAISCASTCRACVFGAVVMLASIITRLLAILRAPIAISPPVAAVAPVTTTASTIVCALVPTFSPAILLPSATRVPVRAHPAVSLAALPSAAAATIITPPPVQAIAPCIALTTVATPAASIACAGMAAVVTAVSVLILPGCQSIMATCSAICCWSVSGAQIVMLLLTSATLAGLSINSCACWLTAALTLGALTRGRGFAPATVPVRVLIMPGCPVAGALAMMLVLLLVLVFVPVFVSVAVLVSVVVAVLVLMTVLRRRIAYNARITGHRFN